MAIPCARRKRHAGHALKKRKPITALLIPTSNDSNLLVVCDDGSVWLKRHDEWTPQEPIPGTAAADDPEIRKARE